MANANAVVQTIGMRRFRETCEIGTSQPLPPFLRSRFRLVFVAFL